MGDAFLLGLNAHNGAIEVLSPVSEPSLSYVLPHKDASVRLHWAGSGRAPLPLDRTLPGFQHLGDVTLRIQRKGEGRWSTYSTVARAPWTQPACGSESDASRRPTVRVDPSGHISPHLPTSPHISPHLPISPHISQVHTVTKPLPALVMHQGTLTLTLTLTLKP